MQLPECPVPLPHIGHTPGFLPLHPSPRPLPHHPSLLPPYLLSLVSTVLPPQYWDCLPPTRVPHSLTLEPEEATGPRSLPPPSCHLLPPSYWSDRLAGAGVPPSQYRPNSDRTHRKKHNSACFFLH